MPQTFPRRLTFLSMKRAGISETAWNLVIWLVEWESWVTTLNSSLTQNKRTFTSYIYKFHFIKCIAFCKYSLYLSKGTSQIIQSTTKDILIGNCFISKRWKCHEWVSMTHHRKAQCFTSQKRVWFTTLQNTRLYSGCYSITGLGTVCKCCGCPYFFTSQTNNMTQSYSYLLKLLITKPKLSPYWLTTALKWPYIHSLI